MATLSKSDSDKRYYVTKNYETIFSAYPIISSGIKTNHYVLDEEVAIIVENKDRYSNYPFRGSIVIGTEKSIYHDLDSAKLICELNHE